MSEALRDDEGLAVVGAEQFSMPVQETRRIMAQIHGNIKDFTTQATNELDLGMGRLLKMQAAHGAALGGEGVVDLCDVLAGDERLQFFSAKHTLQIPPTVAHLLALQDLQASKRRIQYVKAGTQVCSAAASYSWICCTLVAAMSAPCFQAWCQASVIANVVCSCQRGRHPSRV